MRPYDGPDAQTIIQNVNARANNPRGHNGRQQSMSMANGGNAAGVAHRRGASYAGGSLGRAGGLDVAAANSANIAKDPSPTLPSLPSHPTLNALISSSLNDLTPPGQTTEGTSYIGSESAPRVGDPARRMVGHALGIRHPGIGKADSGIKEVEKSMGGVAITAE